MKNLLKAMTLTAMLATTTASYAAQAQKIGYVIPNKVMQESPLLEKMKQKLEAEFSGRYKEIQKMEDEIQGIDKKIKQDGELLSNSELTALNRDREAKIAAYQLKRKAFEEDNQRRQAEMQQEALKTVRAVIDDVAKKGDYDIILTADSVAFAKPEFDISDKVIQEISTK